MRCVLLGCFWCRCCLLLVVRDALCAVRRALFGACCLLLCVVLLCVVSRCVPCVVWSSLCGAGGALVVVRCLLSVAVLCVLLVVC